MGECDAKFYNEHLIQGWSMGLHCSNSYICPVAMLEQYMKLDECDLDKLGLSSTKPGYWLRDSGGISYTSGHELVLKMLKAIGPDAKQLALGLE